MTWVTLTANKIHSDGAVQANRWMHTLGWTTEVPFTFNVVHTDHNYIDLLQATLQLFSHMMNGKWNVRLFDKR